MAFNLIKPSLDLSKVRSNAKNKNQNSEDKNQTEIKSNQNQIKTEQTEIKPDSSPFFENKEERNKNKEDICSVVHNACACEEGDEAAIVEGYQRFLKEHPAVVVDITNPSLIASVDYALLTQKISESKFLQTRKSLDWLIRSYRKIISDTYKDYSQPVQMGKGDLQLWREFVKARERAREEEWCEEISSTAPLYRMAGEKAKKEMGEVYKGLSREVQEYFDPPSFLELCRMEDEELKYERGRFLKALGGIRARLAKEKKDG